MRAVWEGIVRTLKNWSAIRDVVTGVHFGYAPDSNSMPYVRINMLPGMDIEDTTGAAQIERRVFEIQAFSTDVVVVTTLMEEIEKALKETIDLEEGRCLEVNKTSDLVEEDPDRTEEGERVFFGTGLYEALDQREI
jgi:hypothetical protein